MACSKCGGNHFNFVRCADHAAKMAEQARRERSPVRVYRPREGERQFGHRLIQSEVNPASPNVVYIPRKNHPLYDGKDAA